MPQSRLPNACGLPIREPEWLARWRKLASNDRLREKKGPQRRLRCMIGPPYAETPPAHRHARNKTIKDMDLCAAIRMNGFWCSATNPVGIATVCPIENGRFERAIPPKKVKTKTTCPITISVAEVAAKFAAGLGDVQARGIQTPWHPGNWADPYPDDGFFKTQERVIARKKFNESSLMTAHCYQGSASP